MLANQEGQVGIPLKKGTLCQGRVLGGEAGAKRQKISAPQAKNFFDAIIGSM